MTQTWLASMLLTFPIPSRVSYPDNEDYLVEVDAVYEHGAIYVRLEPDYAYDKVHIKLYIETLDILHSFWKRGSILLDPKNDANFIKRWDLIQSVSVMPSDEDDVRKVYHPRWVNHWIAPSPTDFLIERRSGADTIQFGLVDSQVKRHFVAMELSDRKLIFSDKYAIVTVNDYQDAEEVHALIVEAVNKINGDVYINMIPTQYRNWVDYQDLSRGLVRSYLV